MQTVNIHHAKTHLSRLVEMAANGEPFIIAKAGKPMVKVEAVQVTVEAAPARKRFGFLPSSGPILTREEFKAIAAEEIVEGFYGSSSETP